MVGGTGVFPGTPWSSAVGGASSSPLSPVARLINLSARALVGTGENADLYYSKVDKGVRYMSMSHDVRITQEGGRYTRSQLAEFFGPTDTIVLTGFPAVYDGDDAVTGDKITVYRATGVVEVMATNAAGTQQQKGQKIS